MNSDAVLCRWWR